MPCPYHPPYGLQSPQPPYCQQPAKYPSCLLSLYIQTTHAYLYVILQRKRTTTKHAFSAKWYVFLFKLIQCGYVKSKFNSTIIYGVPCYMSGTGNTIKIMTNIYDVTITQCWNCPPLRLNRSGKSCKGWELWASISWTCIPMCVCTCVKRQGFLLMKCLCLLIGGEASNVSWDSWVLYFLPGEGGHADFKGLGDTSMEMSITCWRNETSILKIWKLQAYRGNRKPCLWVTLLHGSEKIREPWTELTNTKTRESEKARATYNRLEEVAWETEGKSVKNVSASRRWQNVKKPITPFVLNILNRVLSTTH